MKRAIIVFLTCWLAAPVFASEFQTTSGTMMLGGTATFNVEMAIPKEGDSVSGFSLTLSPTFGYFIIDNLQLRLGVGVLAGFGDLYENSGKAVGFGVGGHYFIQLSSLALHLGVDLGMGFSIPNEGDTTKTFNINAPLGLIVPLNQHVGLDLGVTVTYSMGLDDQGSRLNMPIGYLGVMGVF